MSIMVPIRRIEKINYFGYCQGLTETEGKAMCVKFEQAVYIVQIETLYLHVCMPRALPSITLQDNSRLIIIIRHQNLSSLNALLN